jgi:hypothetical protein
MISNRPSLALEKREAHCIRIKQPIYEAFEKLCELHGFQRLSDVVEAFMLRSLDNHGLFLLVAYGGLKPTHKRRRKGSVKGELEQQLRAGHIRDTSFTGELSKAQLQREVNRLRKKVEELTGQRLAT